MTFGIQCIELSCNITIIDLLISSGCYCCYTTLGNKWSA